MQTAFVLLLIVVNLWVLLAVGVLIVLSMRRTHALNAPAYEPTLAMPSQQPPSNTGDTGPLRQSRAPDRTEPIAMRIRVDEDPTRILSSESEAIRKARAAKSAG